MHCNRIKTQYVKTFLREIHELTVIRNDGLIQSPEQSLKTWLPHFPMELFLQLPTVAAQNPAGSTDFA